MGATLEEYRTLLEDEYDWLCQRLQLEPVALILTHDNDLKDAPRYGGTPRHIEIPYSDNDLSVIFEASPTSPSGPPTWEDVSPSGRAFWEEWRSTLWHEVSHQVQDQRGFGWNPMVQDGHDPTWDEALQWMATQLGCPSGQMLKRLVPTL